jgi:hypothetical protein
MFRLQRKFDYIKVMGKISIREDGPEFIQIEIH